MNRDVYSFRETPRPLNPEEREIQDPTTTLMCHVNDEGIIDEAKAWDEKVIPLHTKFQLLKEEKTGQFAIVAWPEAEFTSTHTPDHYTEFTQPEGYRTSYGNLGQFEEIGLYSSLKEIRDKIKNTDVDFDPIAHMQNAIDTTLRDKKDLLENKKKMTA